MEAVSCLKSLVSAASQYRSSASDENLVHLLRQLDVRFRVVNWLTGPKYGTCCDYCSLVNCNFSHFLASLKFCPFAVD